MPRLWLPLLDAGWLSRGSTHHDRVARRGDKVVSLLHDETVLTAIVAKLLHPLLLPTEHLEAPGLHALEHLGNARLHAHADRLMRGVILQHLQSVMAILVRQLVARTLIMLQTVMRPCARDPVAPRLNRGNMDGRRCLRLAIR